VGRRNLYFPLFFGNRRLSRPIPNRTLKEGYQIWDRMNRQNGCEKHLPKKIQTRCRLRPRVVKAFSRLTMNNSTGSPGAINFQYSIAILHIQILTWIVNIRFSTSKSQQSNLSMQISTWILNLQFSTSNRCDFVPNNPQH